MKFIFSFLILAFCFGAQAEFKKTNCAGVNSQYFENIFLEVGANCATVEKIQKQFNLIKSFAPIQSITALFVQKKSYESFGTFGGVLVLNQEQQAWDRIRPQAQNEIIWLHELGHVYFTTRLIKDFEPIQGFANYMAEAAKLAIETSNPYTDDSPKLGRLWKEEFALARDIQVPYNELFADLIAVLTANDTMAMTKAMQSPGMPSKAKKETSYYGFAGNYNLNNWNETNAHFLFAPARAFIGNKFLNYPLDRKQKTELVKKVYSVCLAEIKKHWALGKKLPTASEANKSLIKALSVLESH